MTSKEQETIQYTEMPDDPVYNYLKTKESSDSKLVGAAIIDNKPYTYNSPRKIILAKVLIEGQEKVYSFSYNKLLRDLKK